MKRNAIILAAGKSNKFAPFTYEKPKGLFRVRGEILIERQIEQLQEAGVENIYIVVGYMKEKFFYLENKYGVKLISNNEFGKKGNIYSLFVAKSFLGNTYICCADHFFVDNPFLFENKENKSYRTCSYQKGKFREFGIEVSDAGVITSTTIGGSNCLAMVGPAYVNKEFCIKFNKLMEEEIDDFGISLMFWEEFYAKHSNQLTLYAKEVENREVLEFDDIEDLCAFDTDFLLNIDSDILSNICDLLKCNPNEIYDISIINAGLTNVSFSFRYSQKKYIYRHPGGTAGNLIDRKTELFAQTMARKIGIDKSYIKMDLEGWKISYFVDNARNCNFEKDDNQLRIAMNYLHQLHSIRCNEEIKTFDNIEEGKRLMRIASSKKGNLFREFSEILTKVDLLYDYVKEDAKRMGYEKVLCHNDVYEPNYLCDKGGNIYLIDWEYAGLNYEANDIACILCRYDWTNEQVEKYLRMYMGRELTNDEWRFYIAYIPICAFYWFCWGLYKGSVGDDDGFFFMPAYRNLIKYIDVAISSYR